MTALLIVILVLLAARYVADVVVAGLVSSMVRARIDFVDTVLAEVLRVARHIDTVSTKILAGQEDQNAMWREITTRLRGH